jgi:hypothetical protein
MLATVDKAKRFRGGRAKVGQCWSNADLCAACYLAPGPIQSIGAKSIFHGDSSSLDRRYFLALARNLLTFTIGKADKDFTVHSIKADAV